ncbi:metal-dependent hydrolase [Desulfurobacterium atlanticum]|uniref:Inner membrane protein n=1 Tax=Desulfurobacterium atlanticum TaxID=240169 RepID=A0A238ZMM4_9BACT|nr:metal-dependent hydrolase [Desulfurobacterium atlanticum]SNR84580.1 inner membrane protein [Desulfurobacterium atlanticum]
MTTGTHILAGVIAALYLNLPVLPAVIGSVIPDIDIKNGFPKKRNLFNTHRGITHHIAIPVTLIALSFYLKETNFSLIYKNLLSFSIGYTTHILLDTLTPLGIPYTHKFYPRISLKVFRSNKISEIIVFLALLLILTTVLNKKKLNLNSLIGEENISIINSVLK